MEKLPEEVRSAVRRESEVQGEVFVVVDIFVSHDEKKMRVKYKHWVNLSKKYMEKVTPSKEK